MGQTAAGENERWAATPRAVPAPSAALPHRDLDLTASHGIIIALQITDFYYKDIDKEACHSPGLFFICIGKFVTC